MAYSVMLTSLIASQITPIEAMAVDFSILAAAPSNAAVLDPAPVGLSWVPCCHMSALLD